MESDQMESRRAEREAAAAAAQRHQEILWNFDFDVSDDGVWFNSPVSQMSERSLESIDSGVSLQSDRSKAGLINFKDRLFPRRAERKAQREREIWVDSFLSEKKHNVTYVEDWIKSSDDQMSERSLESIDSGVSLKSDQSKAGLINFKDRVFPRRATRRAWLRKERLWNFDSDVSADEDWFKSPVSQRAEIDAQLERERMAAEMAWLRKKMRAMGRTTSEPAKSGFHIPLRQQSPLMRAEREAQRERERRATGSMVSIDSGVSLKSDQSKEDVIHSKDRVSPRLADSSPSEEEHDVSDDEDLVKSPDDQGRETNQEVG